MVAGRTARDSGGREGQYRNEVAVFMKTSAQIRQAFLDYFASKGHRVVSSSSLVPGNDPTLLFTNAGMVQFKDAFLGLEKRAYERATTSQKCMRVSGKHNDLENVGPSPRHHTFFEMLGNFSFGDYFKKEAIAYAYECLTEVFGLDPERMYYTVHTDDDEAYGFWVDDMQIIPERVYRMGDKTNFWMMGDIGPCGPTSEVHYDLGAEYCTCGRADCSVALDNGCERWLEVWNLVFMQYNQLPDGAREPLPKTGVDTGMGLERLVSIIQEKRSTYETDLFTPIMDHVQQLLEHTDAQREQHLIAYRVIADHGRAITFMIGDGVMPGNEGRRYVLRLILRRAARFGRMAGFTEPFLAQVARKVIEEMGEHYTELKARQEFIVNVITQEEERFYQTYEFGLGLLTELMENLKAEDKAIIPGEDVFRLHATYGFPFELTRDIAVEYGFSVDEPGFRQAMSEHEKVSASDQFKLTDGAALTVYVDLLEALRQESRVPVGGVDYDPYSDAALQTRVVSILRDGKRVSKANMGEEIEIILAATPFYVESGGQVNDVGSIGRFGDGEDPLANAEALPQWQFYVSQVIRPVSGLIVHRGRLETGTAHVDDAVWAMVDEDRRWDIMRNHTATHLLHRELRFVLGEHVQQAGSLVAPDHLRFDFTHSGMMTKDELHMVESMINDAILANYPVDAVEKKYRDAVAGGAMALFGEKYGDVVRVVRVGVEEQPISQELCGGTHVTQTGDIGSFHVVSEGSVAAGVRRIEAVTGRYAYHLAQKRMSVLDSAAAFMVCRPEEVDRKVLGLMEQVQTLEKRIEGLQRDLARRDFDVLLSEIEDVAGVQMLAAQVDVAEISMLREMGDWFRDKLGSAVIVLGAVVDDKPSFVAVVTPDLVERGLHAGHLVKAVAQEVGGGGGGKPTMAQAGGRDTTRMPQALKRARTWVQDKLEH
jgi:alanyl-tRNA synthetase